MRLRAITTSVLFAALLLALPGVAKAEHVAPSGVTEEGASQLIAWYDQSEDFSFQNGNSFFQVTNLSSSQGVNIHVQIFADSLENSTDLCREHNYTDTLTPNDTVLYVIGDLDSPSMGAPIFGGDNDHDPIFIDLDGTRGFFVVTAVQTITIPRRAISHNFLIGTMGIIGGPASDFQPIGVRFNAQGREAVSFTTGDHTPDGTLLDGINNGLRLIQPTTLQFAFGTDRDSVFWSVNSIAFSDTYSDPNGEYRSEPVTVTLDPLIFDEVEIGVSCQQHVHTCFVSHGLNQEGTASVAPFDDDELLCPANDNQFGWVKMAVSGLSGLDNAFGIRGLAIFDTSNSFSVTAFGLADWMVTD